MIDLEANFGNLTTSQQVIVRTWNRIRESGAASNAHEYAEDSRYSQLDHATAVRCGVSVESVGDALVAAGLRPVLWWIG